MRAEKSNVSYRLLVGIIFSVSAVVPFFLESKLCALMVWLLPAFMLLLDRPFREATTEIYRKFLGE